MASSPTLRSIVILLLLFIFSAAVFFVIGQWAKQSTKIVQAPTIKSLNQEITELESSMIELEILLQDKGLELTMKDDLLEEKNIELAFMSDKMKKMEAQQIGDKGLIAALKEKLSGAKQQLRLAFEAVKIQKETMGLVYRVQLGALDVEDSGIFPLGKEYFAVEIVDGYQKYLLGNFRSYDESLAYRDLLRELGLTDAWVVPFMDGERTELSVIQASYAGADVAQP